MHRRRILAAIILASFAAFAVAAVTTITGKSTSDRAKRCAAGLTSHTVHGLADLTALFRQQQSLYLRIALPTPDFLLRQSCGTVAFDPCAEAAYSASGSGFGDLTVGEARQIQGVVNKTSTPLDVVGSAARGGRGAASDIDYVIAPDKRFDLGPMEEELPGLDKHGPLPSYHNPGKGPGIRFEPGKKPVVIPGDS